MSWIASQWSKDIVIIELNAEVVTDEKIYTMGYLPRILSSMNIKGKQLVYIL